MVEMATCMRYVDGKGDSGRLFIARPHEVVRYARLLREMGLLAWPTGVAGACCCALLLRRQRIDC
jgi:hypothetical protein